VVRVERYDPAAEEEAVTRPGEAFVHRQAMLTARRLVEAHIEAYGYVPHPDKLKEAIATEIVSASLRP
jgi:hypothetical protein